MPAYRVTFDRIGRTHEAAVLTLDTEAADADDLSARIYRHARRFLGSRDVEVVVDLETPEVGKGAIFCGMHVGGRFTVGPQS